MNLHDLSVHFHYSHFYKRTCQVWNLQKRARIWKFSFNALESFWYLEFLKVFLCSENDCNWYRDSTGQGKHFVVRLKPNYRFPKSPLFGTPKDIEYCFFSQVLNKRKRGESKQRAWNRKENCPTNSFFRRTVGNIRRVH